MAHKQRQNTRHFHAMGVVDADALYHLLGGTMKTTRSLASVMLALAFITPITNTTKTPPPMKTETITYISYKMPTIHLVRASRSRTFALPAVWKRLAWCESRGHLGSVSKSGTYHGMFQIHKGWFKSHGINPKTATLQQQWKLAQYIYHRQGAKAWPYCSKKAGLK